ncbi:hypothetical protein Ancab_011623 [Ancistrocladus abbreviatus]
MHQAQHNSCVLEIKVVSAEDLRINGRPITKNTFAHVRTDPNHYFSTKLEVENGSYPRWDEKFHLPLPSHAKEITVEVMCCKKFSGNVIVGVVKIPISDFTKDYIPPHYLHLLSYRLKDRHGRHNGIINLSIKTEEGLEFKNK